MQLIDFILNIDVHLAQLMASYGVWVYGIIFAIIFIETGAVVMPFLPGDSLIFAAGAFAAATHMNILVLMLIMPLAAILGDMVNYLIGRHLGSKLLERDDGRFIKKKHLHETQAFFDRHGGKAIILARFVPFVRTFAPFVAGVGHMDYKHFESYNIIGAFIWTWGFLILGYFFGNIPFVKENFSLVIIGIIVVSVLPAIWSAIQSKLPKRSVYTQPEALIDVEDEVELEDLAETFEAEISEKDASDSLDFESIR